LTGYLKIGKLCELLEPSFAPDEASNIGEEAAALTIELVAMSLSDPVAQDVISRGQKMFKWPVSLPFPTPRPLLHRGTNSHFR
jgi:hypothetical protein